ncbi:MAG: hypothetical protein J6S85_26615 [Methanobrevibacter sp.]|nr:hypothetical protein [Methanobrevibacter sp.]MBO7717168.1 hypothetical protein [Methanobrevibacter sp.]
MIKDYIKQFEKWETKRAQEEMLFPLSLAYWRETLLEYCCKLFTWQGLPETIPQHEIEMSLFLCGYNTLVKLSNGTWISAVESGLTGITDYYDIFTEVNFATPLHYGKREIGKNAVVIRNDTLMNGLLNKINRYAIMLAHAEISLVAELVNDRESELIEVFSDIHAEGAREYKRKLYNGQLDVYVNKGFSGAKVTPTAARSLGESSKAWETRNNILSAFFEEIGIKRNTNKKERMITDEVTSNNELLLLNLSDMLEARQKGADEFNKLTGFKVSVKCNVDYVKDVDNKTGIENEVEKDVKETI